MWHDGHPAAQHPAGPVSVQATQNSLPSGSRMVTK
jgi:hypothetical protein